MIAPFTPFIGLYGFVNGFEVHRTLFAFSRMRELLSTPCLTPYPAIPTLGVGGISTSKEYDVCIAVGGEWSFRVYDYWPAIACWLVKQGYSVSLVGSSNGAEQAIEICRKEPLVRSTVGSLSLLDAVGEIAKARIFIGADGGLWHIACAIPIPSVVLFADCQIFDASGNRVTRETQDMICESLYDDYQVSNISQDAIIESIKRLTARIGTRPVDALDYGPYKEG
jgi:ADP-heptose:LPS heptosyltransferase